MPGKKKKGKAKGKGGGGDGTLPPPPNLDDTRQGALEALLKFRIHGKEDSIEQFEEESEVYKDKNDQLKEKNHFLKAQRGEHYKRLVKQAREHERKLEELPSVDQGSVDQALTEKLELVQKLKDDLQQHEKSIAEVDQVLKFKSAELKTWKNFKDVIKDRNSSKIRAAKEKMEGLHNEVANIQSDYEIKLIETKNDIDEKTELLLEREKELVSEHFLSTMDENTRLELSDNAWLKQEIATTKMIVKRLSSEVSTLEHRNIKAFETVTGQQTADIETTREIYLATNRKGLTPFSGGGLKQVGDTSGLPSLVNVAQCTSEEGPGGQAGQFEMKLLSLSGRKAPIISPPDSFHLPPLDQQLRGIPQRTTWPVSHSMMKSVQ